MSIAKNERVLQAILHKASKADHQCTALVIEGCGWEWQECLTGHKIHVVDALHLCVLASAVDRDKSDGATSDLNKYRESILRECTESISVLELRDIDCIQMLTSGVILETVRWLKALMDSLHTQVLIVMQTENLDQLPPFFRDSAYWQSLIKVPAMSNDDRREYLESQLGRPNNADINELTHNVSLMTSGFTRDDLERLCQLAELDSSSDELTLRHFQSALATFIPVSSRVRLNNGMTSTHAPVPWSKIVGYERLKNRLQMLLSLPFRKTNSIIPSKLPGMLLYGPPGCGKTLISYTFSNQIGVHCMRLRGPEIIGMYVGETEQKIRELFKEAKACAPSLLIIDEFECLAGRRSASSDEEEVDRARNRILMTFLTEMDGVDSDHGVAVVGCTTRPDLIDDAMMRPGRLDHLLLVDRPSLEDRMAIMKNLHWDDCVGSVDWNHLAEITNNWACCDLECLMLNARQSDNYSMQVIMTEFNSMQQEVNQRISAELDVLSPIYARIHK